MRRLARKTFPIGACEVLISRVSHLSPLFNDDLTLSIQSLSIWLRQQIRFRLLALTENMFRQYVRASEASMLFRGFVHYFC